MTVFVICGTPENKQFCHARYVANYLSEYLPFFRVRIIEMPKKEWPSWITEQNLKHSWYHLDAPLIWKELNHLCGKPHYVGGLSEFWEYIYDYYNLQSLLNNHELQKLAAESLQYYTITKKKTEKEKLENRFIICIAGDQIKYINLLIMQLICLDSIFGRKELIIRIFKFDCEYSEQLAIIDYYEVASKFKITVEMVEELRNALVKCDVLIVTGDFVREPDESFDAWLNRNHTSMVDLAAVINEEPHPYMKVIVADHGPSCFNTAVLVQYISTMKKYNIVALTADLGLETLHEFSKCNSCLFRYLNGPPVWGFTGINKLIDFEHMIKMYSVYRPYKRATKYNPETTLTLGRTCATLGYCHDISEQIQKTLLSISEKKKHAKYSEYKFYPKVRAIISLLTNWCSQTNYRNIISLGIISDGTFGIPPGIVFSQPCEIRNRRWTPVKEFPIPRKDPAGIDDLILFVKDVYTNFKLDKNVEESSK